MRALPILGALLLAAPGCDRLAALTFDRPPPPPPPAASGAGRTPTEGPSVRALDGGAPARAALPLDPKVRRSMKLSPRAAAQPGLVFAKGRIGVLARDALVVRDTVHFTEALRLPLDRPRALAVLADGSLLAADSSRALWLLPHDTKARSLPRIPLFPESTLFADRRRADRIWVLPGFGSTLFGFDLAPSPLGMLPTKEWVELDGYDHRALGSLRDGSFLYSTSAGLRQFYGPKKKDAIQGDARDAFRLLPASRPDTVWILAGQGARLFRLVAGKLFRLHAVELATTPYDADAAGEYLAVLELSQPSDQPWSFVLEVFDVAGKRRLRETLPAEESLDESWLLTMTRNRRLALSADPPMVAVGGPESLTVWQADKGTRIYSEP